MKAAVFAFTEQGRDTARRILAAFAADQDAADLYVPSRLAGLDCETFTGGLSRFVGDRFDRDVLVFVGACGIAVRAIAPHVTDKLHDPAVLVVDERAGFVVSLLSGHVGGANRLALRLARALGATPVVTTATDVNGRFSVDAWAADRGFQLGDMALAKRVSAQILTRDIPICADAPLPERLPEGLVPGDFGELGICVTTRLRDPFAQTLRLVPKALRVGVGCRRGTPTRSIDDAVSRALEENRLDAAAVSGVATIDLKADEEGLLAFCRDRNWPVFFYTTGDLRRVECSTWSSPFVERTVGVDNVCERAALAAGGRLVVPRQARDGVTVAVAEMEWGIDFGQG